MNEGWRAITRALAREMGWGDANLERDDGGFGLAVGHCLFSQFQRGSVEATVGAADDFEWQARQTGAYPFLLEASAAWVAPVRRVVRSGAVLAVEAHERPPRTLRNGARITPSRRQKGAPDRLTDDIRADTNGFGKGSMSGLGPSAQSSENSDDVVEMVVCFVHSVASEPGQVPLSRLRPVVDERTRPRRIV